VSPDKSSQIGCQNPRHFGIPGFIFSLPIYGWLVVEPTPLKNMSSSVGMMTFPIYGKKMFQTTNQMDIIVESTIPTNCEATCLRSAQSSVEMAAAPPKFDHCP